MVGGIGPTGVSPALEQASLLFKDLGWQTSGPLTGAAGAGSPPSWMTALDAAGTPQVPASAQSTLGSNVDLRL